MPARAPVRRLAHPTAERGAERARRAVADAFRASATLLDGAAEARDLCLPGPGADRYWPPLEQPFVLPVAIITGFPRSIHAHGLDPPGGERACLRVI